MCVFVCIYIHIYIHKQIIKPTMGIILILAVGENS